MGRTYAGGFRFNVKAFRLFTGHQAQPRVFPKDLQEALGSPLTQNVYYRDLPEEIQKELCGRFFQALEPLHAAGKLGAIHFQFAPWITSAGEPRQLVEHCARVMSGTLMAVEFRTHLGGPNAIARRLWHSSASMGSSMWSSTGPKASATACQRCRR